MKIRCLLGELVDDIKERCDVQFGLNDHAEHRYINNVTFARPVAVIYNVISQV